MSYELFQQGPDVYLPVILLSLIFTVLGYGSFPFIFAKTRKTPITKKKYKGLCYGINVAVMVMFIAINGGAYNGAPYFLWTWIFSNYGIKVLNARGIMIDSEYLEDNSYHVISNDELSVDTDKIYFCRKCGEKLIDSSRFCRKCGTEVVEIDNTVDPVIANWEFCKRCGADISNDTDVCHVCGEKKGNN